MNIKTIMLAGVPISLALLLTVITPAQGAAAEMQAETAAMNDTECGKMYLWGREVQNEPYNRAASLARCEGSRPVNPTETEEKPEVPQNPPRQPAQ